MFYHHFQKLVFFNGILLIDDSFFLRYFWGVFRGFFDFRCFFRAFSKFVVYSGFLWNISINGYFLLAVFFSPFSEIGVS